jgi:uncharacterized protein YbbC (DUF1343 family)
MIRSIIKILIGISILLSFTAFLQVQTFKEIKLKSSDDIVVGAHQAHLYLPLLKGKKVAIVANHTSLINSTHLVDSLLNSGINIVKVFCPEHGFRGNEDAGKKIRNTKDPVSGLPIISLYGRKYKPSRKDLKKVDIVIFDIQDVGVRFYTYISTMTYVMEACAEHNIPMIILDRPNPNGFYVDGPLLDEKFKSFVGLHPVPIVYGMTIGEYAIMVNNEGWLKNNIKCDLKVIKLSNYDHNKFYQLPITPSPNLPNMFSVYLYPSLALFEGTIISVGRGTDQPFQVIGHPDYLIGSYLFKPESRTGATYPKYCDIECHGVNLREYTIDYTKNLNQINLQWLIDMYEYLSDKEEFFNNYFNLLVGNRELIEQIKQGKNQQEIRLTWQEDLDQYKKMRKKYLLYPDFE